MSDPLTSNTMSQIDAAVATRLLELSDGSNYGTLDELQSALIGWAMDLNSGAISLADEVQGASDETNDSDSVSVALFERYRRCLYRANGRLIQLGQEPEKLEYPTAAPERLCVVCGATSGFTSPLNLCQTCETAMQAEKASEQPTVSCVWRDGCRLAGVCEKQGWCTGSSALNGNGDV